MRWWVCRLGRQDLSRWGMAREDAIEREKLINKISDQQEPSVRSRPQSPPPHPIRGVPPEAISIVPACVLCSVM